MGSTWKVKRVQQQRQRRSNIDRVLGEFAFDEKIKRATMLKQCGLNEFERRRVDALVESGVSFQIAVHHILWNKRRASARDTASEQINGDGSIKRRRARMPDDKRFDYIACVNEFLKSGESEIAVQGYPRHEGETRSWSRFYSPNKQRFDDLINKYNLPLCTEWDAENRQTIIRRTK